MALPDFPLFPVEASTLAPRVDLLYLAWIVLGGATSLLVAALVVGFGIRYRRGSTAPRKAREMPVTAIEFAWTLGPMALFMGMFVWAALLYYQAYNPPADAMTVYAVGKMWMWKLQDADGRREIDELHVPVGRAVKVLLTSEDVIHSFYVPAFRVKQDAFPGRYTATWFEASRPGRYHLFCAEYCGLDHARMLGDVVALAPADYARWQASRPEGAGLAQRGEKLFSRYGCAGCHVGTSSVRAPKLDGVFGAPVPLQTGTFVTADETYLHDSIVWPEKQVVAGYAPKMPSFRGVIGEEDLAAIVAYIQSLGDERTSQ
jgi:cytochrome c oxidase subunit 2